MYFGDGTQRKIPSTRREDSEVKDTGKKFSGPGITASYLYNEKNEKKREQANGRKRQKAAEDVIRPSLHIRTEADNHGVSLFTDNRTSLPFNSFSV